ncbi:MAG: hypothetical protein Q9157_002058 [Trypethelium eluteriae]
MPSKKRKINRRSHTTHHAWEDESQGLKERPRAGVPAVANAIASSVAAFSHWTEWPRHEQDIHPAHRVKPSSSMATQSSFQTTNSSDSTGGTSATVAAPLLPERKRTVQSPERVSPPPVHPAIRPLHRGRSTPTPTARYIPISTMYSSPGLKVGQPLPPVPEASSITDPHSTSLPYVNPAYAAFHARREGKALEYGDTSTEILCEPDEDQLTIVSESDFNPGSIIVQHPSREEEQERRVSVLRRPPGPRIARLPNQDVDWETLQMKPLPPYPLSARNLATVPCGEPLIAPAFDPQNPPKRSEVEGLRYLNEEYALYWEQPDVGAPVRPQRRASVEWGKRQDRLRRVLAGEREQRTPPGRRVRRSWSDWVLDRRSQVADQMVEEEDEREEPIILQPTVYVPPTSKQKGKAPIRSREESLASEPDWPLPSPLPRIPPPSPLLPPPLTARKSPVEEFERRKSDSKGSKSGEA